MLEGKKIDANGQIGSDARNSDKTERTKKQMLKMSEIDRMIHECFPTKESVEKFYSEIPLSKLKFGKRNEDYALMAKDRIINAIIKDGKQIDLYRITKEGAALVRVIEKLQAHTKKQEQEHEMLER